MEYFTEIFNQEYNKLGLNDKRAAEVLDVSVPTIRRWREGKTVPPAAKLVLKLLRELDKEVI